MIASSLLPLRLRNDQSMYQRRPFYLGNKAINSILQYLSKTACKHPIHTLCTIAILVSTTYIRALKNSVFHASGNTGTTEWDSSVTGSQSLITGPQTGWKWQTFDAEADIPETTVHQVLMTLVFPGSDAEMPQKISSAFAHIPSNLPLVHLPSTSNSFTTYSQHNTFPFLVEYSNLVEALAAIRDIPSDSSSWESFDANPVEIEHKTWIMKSRRIGKPGSLSLWAQSTCAEFLDLLKNAQPLDIPIMVLGYLSMHLTFISLFMSMKKLGSRVWLATSVLLSSTFAFLLALHVSIKLGVPVNMKLLSEGLPFLVVIIGFEKNITLTSAVLSHSVEHRNRYKKHSQDIRDTRMESTIQYAIRSAINDKGYSISCHYFVEILLLVLGAAANVQGGLRHFCVLAALILFFDFLLLFTFYVAIMSIKLEVNRIKRHFDTRYALQDEGLSQKLAESVAKDNDFEKDVSRSLLGKDGKTNSIPKFKFWMVVGFFAVNLANICCIPSQYSSSGTTLSNISSWTRGLSGISMTPPLDPFKVAGNGLDELLFQARARDQSTVITVLSPINYELIYPSTHYVTPFNARTSDQQQKSTRELSGLYAKLCDNGLGDGVVDGLLTSLEDPVLSKWIFVTLVLSVALNDYLFKAARLGIKDPNHPGLPIDSNELTRAETFNAAQVLTSELILSPQVPQKNGTTSGGVGHNKDSQPTIETIGSLTTRDRALEKKTSIPAFKPEVDHLSNLTPIYELSDETVVALSLQGRIPGYALEKKLKDCTRAVKVRRSIISRTPCTEDITNTLENSKLPYEHYDWERVLGACCENVIGYMPVPVGVAGPIVIDGKSYFIPMATTEGVLVASASRGSKAINLGGGAVTVLTGDGMTRGPCISFEVLERAGAAKNWLDSEAGQTLMKDAFDSTSRFARLQSMRTTIAGTHLYVRFKTTTGDAMGMNMISKGVEHALNVMATDAGFDDMKIVTLSGNYCTDKKPSALNWIDGRGKGIVAEAIIPANVVRDVLKSDVDSMVQLNISKNLIGSAMAGSTGGFNAQAANLVAAVFIATGQDPAQVVEGANCITLMNNLRGSLQISVSMPSIEVGTLGGGTILEPQGAMLAMLGVRGSHPTTPGENARQLARIVGAVVLAGELSLCAALAAGHLVKAHMAHNRATPAP
ncbi:hypothetical protein N7466_008283 [Penicillium verhagenii]|uniref:uncharacterized protein n=1 Tax=Penicillium verhagenii TaxID=1562060 RepID=UPI00254581B9|nr:uncharacterized protein N7466_008283 [Penicillium verhagenii]KAJ5924096.1 hypothetical protein N7466_008283 [Penicillium verhagenii]